ncbi:MAG: N-6 DNA methylase [Candidatus Saelkia tenebricola]|nr:N-6 DNA methylase [Candidatus Saelkia tenebricola]
MCRLQYNERSWAIDVISEINRYVAHINRPIKRGGGENTLLGDATRLFPDVLLFGSATTVEVLQGWELKFPDTAITDEELIKNARKKATNLRLNSFLVWNVTSATLYITDDRGVFVPKKSWNNLTHIRKRDQVEGARAEWVGVLHIIINELNDFFERGELIRRSVIDSLSDAGLIDIVLQNSALFAERLEAHSVENAHFDAVVKLWWKGVKIEHGSRDRQLWNILAKELLVSWVYKFIFAHILKTNFTDAAEIENINEGSSVDDAIAIFERITQRCDFWNIFSLRFGEDLLPDTVWSQLIQLNGFFKTVQLERIDQANLQLLLQSLVHVARRKIAGQFITPRPLARLLVLLTAEDKRLSIFDPCCGTGTIVRAAYELKREYGLSSSDALSNVWGEDKFSFPVQISTLSLTDSNNLGEIIKVFQKDITELSVGENIEFHNPNDGQALLKKFPSIDYIVSNLPFVQQEDVAALNPNINKINAEIIRISGQRLTLDARSDLYSYLPFYLWFILNDGGKLGIILSNSWLGTESGGVFRSLLNRFFNIEKVVISGDSRWFSNVKVVTTLLILKKRTEAEITRAQINENERSSFSVLKNSINDASDTGISNIASKIITGVANGEVQTQNYTKAVIADLEEMGVEWTALFANINWLCDIKEKLVRVNDFFDIKRGERRGWDALFYPAQGHGIEPEYIKPVLKSPTAINNLIAVADKEAFCCSLTLRELAQSGHNGALGWIRRFEHEVNTDGRPLVETLARSNMHWYELKPLTLADLVANINYDERIFIAKMRERSFVNQRLTRFTIRNTEIDVDLCHALLNSILSIFYLEAMGFGRGLGVLDLNATKIKKQMRMLNPYLLDQNTKNDIKRRFQPLLNRPIGIITEELRMADRIEFDNAVLSAFGIGHYREQIVNAFLTLFRTRKAVDR